MILTDDAHWHLWFSAFCFKDGKNLLLLCYWFLMDCCWPSTTKNKENSSMEKWVVFAVQELEEYKKKCEFLQKQNTSLKSQSKSLRNVANNNAASIAIKTRSLENILRKLLILKQKASGNKQHKVLRKINKSFQVFWQSGQIPPSTKLRMRRRGANSHQ